MFLLLFLADSSTTYEALDQTDDIAAAGIGNLMRSELRNDSNILDEVDFDVSWHT